MGYDFGVAYCIWFVVTFQSLLRDLLWFCGLLCVGCCGFGPLCYLLCWVVTAYDYWWLFTFACLGLGLFDCADLRFGGLHCCVLFVCLRGRCFVLGIYCGYWIFVVCLVLLIWGFVGLFGFACG